MSTYNSTLINAGGGVATPSIVPGTVRGVYGSVVIPLNTSFATTDTIPLFNMSAPNAGHIYAFWIDFPALDAGSGLTLTLTDSLTTPTVIVTASTTPQAGGFIDETNAQHATIGSAVTYQASDLIYLKPSHASTNTTGASALTIYFGFEIVQD